jgi:KUP system potassium uptake protein
MITWPEEHAGRASALMRLPTDVFLKDLAEYSPQRTRARPFQVDTPSAFPIPSAPSQAQRALYERVCSCPLFLRRHPYSASERLQWRRWGGILWVKANTVSWSANMPEIHDLVSRKGSIDTKHLVLPGRETLFATGPAHMPNGAKNLFIFMSRTPVTPPLLQAASDRVVELGTRDAVGTSFQARPTRQDAMPPGRPARLR